jgi:hypothetical protein
MIMSCRSLLLLLAGLWLIAAGPARADDALWQPFDRLSAGDLPLAQSALFEMFGDDPDLWPDWLDPRAVLIPYGSADTLLIVREPYRQPCGQFRFVIFGTPGANGARTQLGDGFCAGELAIQPMGFWSMPDLIFTGGHRRAAAGGPWQSFEQRVRWTGQNWVGIEVVKTATPLGWLRGP